MTRTRKAKGRDDLVHLLHQVHHTEIRKVTEKVAVTEVLRAHQNSRVKVHQEILCTTSRREGKIHVIIGMFPNVQISKLHEVADLKTSVHTDIQQNLRMKRNIQHRSLFTFDQMMNGRCIYGKIQSHDKTQYRVTLRHLANKYVLKMENGDLHLESSRPDLEISEIPMLQHSVKDPWNGPCAWKK